MQRHTRQAAPHASQGFTLIELVAVMVIIAALGAMAVPAFNHNDATLPAQADQLARTLRHAQSLALSQGRPLTLNVQSASLYAITNGSNTTPIRDPAGAEQSHTLSNQVTLTGSDIEFDSLGRPVNAGSLITAAQSWTLNGSGSSATVSIQPLTGFVTVSP